LLQQKQHTKQAQPFTSATDQCKNQYSAQAILDIQDTEKQAGNLRLYITAAQCILPVRSIPPNIRLMKKTRKRKHCFDVFKSFS